MSWKTIMITSEKKFSIGNGFLLLKDFNKDDSETIKISLEEIDLILIENIKSLITIASLNELSRRNITLIISDAKHDPSTMMLPITSHHKPLQNFNLQLDQNSRVKNILHKQLIQKKIDNQKIVLEDVGSKEETITKLAKYSSDVTQGDKTNREAMAARIFFREIYGSSFLRFSDDGINSFINFGYKIIASKISNCIVKYGLHPAIGVFHRSQTNYFNLSYDFIEPFRPMVDWLANYLSMELDNELTIPLKLKILRILDMKVNIDGKTFRVKNAIDVMIKSYISFLSGEIDKLSLPTIYLDNIRNQISDGEFPEF